MKKIKKYIIESIREYTSLHSADVDENNLNISDLQYEQNCNEIKAVATEINHKIYKGTDCRLVCGITLCSCGELAVHIYDNNKYKEILHFYLKF